MLIAAAGAALEERRADGGQLALVCVDLDGFKRINDRLGHTVGDRVLQVIATRLVAHAAPTDTVSRFGGDEFVVLRPDADGSTDTWAEEVRAGLAQPIVVGGIRLRVTSSVGLVRADGSYGDVERMLGDADLAMYRAKRDGSNQTAQFRLTMREQATDQARLAADLHSARAEGRLVVHYQPVVDLVRGAVVGAEALVRLRDGDGRLLHPDEFLPLAQTLGLMGEIGAHVLSTACRDFATGPTADTGWWVSVNLGVDELADPQLSERVVDALAVSGLTPGRLVVEVSERALPEPVTRRALEDVHAAGVRVALDDFGSGWSSSAQLRALPLQVVKLDRDLTADAASNGASALFRSVVALARELELEVVAEGVEHPAQADLLRTAGCHHGQGYLWARPSSLDEMLARWVADAEAAGGAETAGDPRDGVSVLTPRREPQPPG